MKKFKGESIENKRRLHCEFTANPRVSAGKIPAVPTKKKQDKQ